MMHKTYHFVMKFSPIVSTSEVELLPELVLFVIEIPSLCPWPSLNPLSDFKFRLFSLSLYAECNAALLATAECNSDALMVATFVMPKDAITANLRSENLQIRLII